MSHDPSRLCPIEDDLLLFHDRALGAVEASRIADHAEQCASCRATLDAAARLDALVSVDVELPSQLEHSLEQLPARHLEVRPTLVLGFGAMAAAALVLVALGPGRGAPTPAPIPRVASSPSLEPGPIPEGPSRLDVLRHHLLEPTLEGRAWIDEGGARLASALHRLVRDEDPGTRRRALAWLVDHPDQGSLPVLLGALKRDDLCELALLALGRFGDARAVSAVAPLLDDPLLGSTALDVVVALGGDQAADLLLARANASEDAEDASLLVASLGQVEGPRAVEGLVDLSSRPDRASDALTALRARRAEATPHLLDRAGSRDMHGARAALRVLAHLAPPEAAHRLGALLDRRALRADVARALLRIDTPAAAEALVRRANDPEIRGLLGGAGAGVEAWLAARLDPGQRVACRRHVELLGLCGGDLAVEALADLVGDPAIAPAIVTALGRIGNERAVAVLAPLAERSALRRPVVEALGATGRSGAVVVLLALVDRHPALRGAVRTALGTIANPDAVRAILELDARSPSLRATRRTLATMDRDVVLTTLNGMIDRDGSPSAHRMLASLRTHTLP